MSKPAPVKGKDVKAPVAATAVKGKGPTKIMSKENPMRDIKVEKLVLNICVGESGDKLTKVNTGF